MVLAVNEGTLYLSAAVTDSRKRGDVTVTITADRFGALSPASCLADRATLQ